MTRYRGEIEKFDDGAWQKAVEQNLMYVIRMARGVLPHMKTRGGGSILNITAISAIQPIRGFGLSVATWSAVIGFAKTLSIEVARYGINVNTICPGYVETPRLEKVFAGGGNTTVYGGAGVDSIVGGAGTDTVLGSTVHIL